MPIAFLLSAQQSSLRMRFQVTSLEGITPYIFESGLNIDMSSDREILIQGVTIYFVIHKRKREMDDIALNEGTLNFCLCHGCLS